MKIKPNHFHKDAGYTTVKRGNENYTVRNNRNRYFFPDEWKAFYDSLDNGNKKLNRRQITFNLLLNTGARIMEIQHIEISDIDLDRGNIMLRVTKKIINRPGIQKTGISKPRVVSISSQLVKFLRKVISQYELKGDDKLPILTTSGANQALERCLESLKIPDFKMFSLHNVRKTNENWLLALGVDFYKMIKQLGHSPNVSMKHYISSDIFSFEEKKEINEILGDLRDKMMGNYGRRY